MEDSVRVISRTNGFIYLSRNVAITIRKTDSLFGARSRTEQCPKVDNVLQYATLDVPDLNVNRDIRWAEDCENRNVHLLKEYWQETICADENRYDEVCGRVKS